MVLGDFKTNLISHPVPYAVLLPDGYKDGPPPPMMMYLYDGSGSRDELVGAQGWHKIGHSQIQVKNQRRCKPLKGLEARVGIEPTHKGFADLSLTTWVPRPVSLRRCRGKTDGFRSAIIP